MVYIQDIIERFGGLQRFSELTGVNKHTARWWTYRAKGFPIRWQQHLLDIAKKHGINLTAEEVVGARSREKKNAS
jgi:hypothetical protein